jgi:hypothetical protein
LEISLMCERGGCIPGMRLLLDNKELFEKLLNTADVAASGGPITASPPNPPKRPDQNQDEKKK